MDKSYDAKPILKKQYNENEWLIASDKHFYEVEERIVTSNDKWEDTGSYVKNEIITSHSFVIE